MKTIIKLLLLLTIFISIGCKTTKTISKSSQKIDSTSINKSIDKSIIDKKQIIQTKDSYQVRIVTHYRFDTIKNINYIDSIIENRNGIINKYDTSFHHTQINIIDSNITLLNKQIDNLEKVKESKNPITNYIIWSLVILFVLYLIYLFVRKKIKS